jgi:hypothetical protein
MSDCTSTITETDSDEIEVTQEMADAGAILLSGYHTLYSGEHSWAIRVYQAMEAVRLGRLGQMSDPS